MNFNWRFWAAIACIVIAFVVAITESPLESAVRFSSFVWLVASIAFSVLPASCRS